MWRHFNLLSWRVAFDKDWGRYYIESNINLKLITWNISSLIYKIKSNRAPSIYFSPKLKFYKSHHKSKFATTHMVLQDSIFFYTPIFSKRSQVKYIHMLDKKNSIFKHIHILVFDSKFTTIIRIVYEDNIFVIFIIIYKDRSQFFINHFIVKSFIKIKNYIICKT